ncbi:hypothetical protein KR038_011690 [Drosophila bunnanda]|nr:hypothetical protein KR038_011690 [Drosophila bunnanda]
MLSHHVLFTTGTTIMALTFDGGVVIGADSRTSADGSVMNRVADKLTELTERIYCCRSGAAADTQALADLVSNNLKYRGCTGKPVEVFRAACEFRNYCYKNRLNTLAGIIVAGWDERCGGQVYSILLGGMMKRMPYAVAGSGAPYIKEYVRNHYKPGMNVKQCIELVKTGIEAGIRFDSSSGGVVRIGVIDKDGIKRYLFHNTTSSESDVSSCQSFASFISSEHEDSST